MYLQEEQIRFFEVTAQRSAGFPINKIVKRLRILFESTSLTEEMHKQNERYEKQIEKLRESIAIPVKSIQMLRILN